MRELETGLWHWEASHPEWTAANSEGWGPGVSSYAIDDGSTHGASTDRAALERALS